MLPVTTPQIVFSFRLVDPVCVFSDHIDARNSSPALVAHDVIPFTYSCQECIIVLLFSIHVHAFPYKLLISNKFMFNMIPIFLGMKEIT